MHPRTLSSQPRSSQPPGRDCRSLSPAAEPGCPVESILEGSAAPCAFFVYPRVWQIAPPGSEVMHRAFRELAFPRRADQQEGTLQMTCRHCCSGFSALWWLVGARVGAGASASSDFCIKMVSEFFCLFVFQISSLSQLSFPFKLFSLTAHIR